jgi:hypothetical protein
MLPKKQPSKSASCSASLTVPELDQSKTTVLNTLLFYGGFAAPAIMNDTAQEAGFLAFMYPAADAEELKKTIGTIDR